MNLDSAQGLALEVNLWPIRSLFPLPNPQKHTHTHTEF